MKKQKHQLDKIPKTWKGLLNEIDKKQKAVDEFKKSHNDLSEIKELTDELRYLQSIKSRAEEELKNKKNDSYNYDGMSL